MALRAPQQRARAWDFCRRRGGRQRQRQGKSADSKFTSNFVTVTVVLCIPRTVNNFFDPCHTAELTGNYFKVIGNWVTISKSQTARFWIEHIQLWTGGIIPPYRYTAYKKELKV